MNRIRWGVLAPTLLVGAVLAIAVVRFVPAETVSPPPSSVAPGSLVLDATLRIDPLVVETEAASVLRLIDGDTLVARVDGARQTIRLFGLQAPERDERCYGEASARLARLAPVGTPLLLHPGPRNDDGSRLLRYAFLEDGRSLDATLVAEGLAEAWRRDGQLRDAIVGLESEARGAGRGCLWAR
ncbi:MAG: Endonuclease YncB, thermonuclease family [Chloroflexi bacterium]|nr:MAG: Endonuclease YncB, thermonuclease family [Chloroflexota bacterium]